MPGRNRVDFEDAAGQLSMDAHEFASKFAPSEYADSWSGVTKHPEYDRDEDGNQAHHALVKDLKANGMHSPVYVKIPENVVQDGHHRVAAALEAGVPVRYQKYRQDLWDGKQIWDVI